MDYAKANICILKVETNFIDLYKYLSHKFPSTFLTLTKLT